MSSTALENKGENTEKFPGWYIDFQVAALQQLPRPGNGKGQIDQAIAQSWARDQASLKHAFVGALLPDSVAVPVEPEVVIDPIVRVDRSIRPSYPDWMKEVMHPELETVGPAEYDITKVKQWLHDGQKGGKWIEGNKIYAHLNDTDTLKTCLGLRDLEEIQKKGIAFFRKHFKGKAVFGLASVVRDRSGGLSASCLCEIDGKVVLGWRWLDDFWYGYYPALRHAS